MIYVLSPSPRAQRAMLSLLGCASLLFPSEASAQSCGCNTFSSPVTVTSSSTTSTGLAVTTAGGIGSLYGTNNASGAYNHGVIGRSYGSGSIGVYGLNSGYNGYGGYMVVTASGATGLYAESQATTGNSNGVYSVNASSSGRGVRALASATNGTTYGVYGEARSSSGTGLYGDATATTGTTYGVSGVSASTSGYGVSGYASATSGFTNGVYGLARSTTGAGVWGASTATTGSAFGVYGSVASTSGTGVYGASMATSGTSFGVKGLTSSSTGYGVFSYGNTGATGTKSAIVPTSHGPTELYAEESTEIWFSDHGAGRLEEGIARVDLDPDFLEVVTVDDEHPLMVFVQLEGEANGVFVEKDDAGFYVVELQDGKSDAAFSYRVVAKRVGYEDRRLRRVDVELDVGELAHREAVVPTVSRAAPPRAVPLPD